MIGVAHDHGTAPGMDFATLVYEDSSSSAAQGLTQREQQLSQTSQHASNQDKSQTNLDNEDETTQSGNASPEHLERSDKATESPLFTNKNDDRDHLVVNSSSLNTSLALPNVGGSARFAQFVPSFNYEPPADYGFNQQKRESNGEFNPHGQFASHTQGYSSLGALNGNMPGRFNSGLGRSIPMSNPYASQLPTDSYGGLGNPQSNSGFANFNHGIQMAGLNQNAKSAAQFSSWATQQQHVNPESHFFPGNGDIDNGVRKRKGTKRRTKSNSSEKDATILWEDLNISDDVASVVFSVLPRDKLSQFLNDGASSIMCTLGSQITPDQQNALKIVKQRLRAEKKSRREKQRRVCVNKNLMKLAEKIKVKPEEQDMNSILVMAVKFIEQQTQEVNNLRSLVHTSNPNADN